jgi:plasmid stability protein
MSKMIQVRNVPDQLHRKLKARAAEEGVSLSDYILKELQRMASRITPAELARRVLAEKPRPDFEPSIAELIREERDRR